MLISLVFGVVWNVKKGDIQGAWGVASWIVAFIATVTVVIQNWGTRS